MKPVNHNCDPALKTSTWSRRANLIKIIF